MKKKIQTKTTSNKINKIITCKINKGNKISNKSKASNKIKKNTTPGSLTRKINSTSDTTKMTFYVKNDLLEKLYNYAYWDRHKITEAFNRVLADGLKGKTTKPIKR